MLPLKSDSAGTTNKVKTIEAPIRLPKDISGVLSTTEKKATDISLIEVKKPKTKKEIMKSGNLVLWDIFSTPEIEIPEPNHIPKNANAT